MLLRYLEKYANSNKIAVYCGKEGLSYKDLWRKTEAMAWFIKENYDTDMPVAIHGDKENEMIICMYAAVKAGKMYVVLPSFYPEDHLQKILDDCNPDLILSPSIRKLSFKGIDIINYEEFDPIYEKYANYPKIKYTINPSDTAFLIYTSGSNGIPKGVRINFANLECMVRNDERNDAGLIDESTERYKEMVLASYAFIVGAIFYFDIGYMGGVCYCVPMEIIRDTDKLVEYMEWAQPHGFVATPSLVNKLLDSNGFNKEKLYNFRTMVLGGEPLHYDCAKSLSERFPNIAIKNAYASTETAGVGVICEITPELLAKKYDILPVSTDNTDVSFIIDENGEKIDTEEKYGEFVFYGDLVSNGYHNRPEMTKESYYVLPDGITKAYRTGDMAYIKNGYVFIAGRKDNQVKIGGNRIEIEEVEARMSSCSAVSECAIAVENKNNNKSLVAFVIPKENSPKKDELELFFTIKSEMMETMEYYKIPQKIIFVDSIPKTNSGKINREKLKELL